MTDTHIEERWAARKRIAMWSFRTMIGMAVVLLSYGLIVPGGPVIIEAMTSLIVTLFTTFAMIVGGYIGTDVVGTRPKTPKAVIP